MTQYIPVRTTTRKDCEALHTTGKGSFGEVYEACIRGNHDCGYVLKVITYDSKTFKERGGKSLERYYRDWYNEAKVFSALNKCQEKKRGVFSPILYDRWYCAEGRKDKSTVVHFYLLMERYDGDLLQLFTDRDLTFKNIVIAMALERMDSYLSIIHDTCKICLNDIKLQNILYKRVGEYDYDLVFADFGISSRHSDDECIKNDRENFKELKEQFRARSR